MCVCIYKCATFGVKGGADSLGNIGKAARRYVAKGESIVFCICMCVCLLLTDFFYASERSKIASFICSKVIEVAEVEGKM